MFKFKKEIKPDPRDQTITLLTAQVNDLLALVEKLTKYNSETVSELTNKLIAVSSPFAWKSLQPKEEQEKTPPGKRQHLPGYRPSTRPPDPEPKKG